MYVEEEIVKTWEEAIAEITAAPGVVMVLGATDTGKSTFCLDLIRAAVDAGVSCAIVDADVGQSDVGPPCTIGMAIVNSKPESLTELKPRRMSFVGSTAPSGHFLECANGTRRMVEAAKELGAQLIVVNTTGMIEGYAARKLKTHKIDLVRPDYLVGLQKDFEIDPLLIPFARINTLRIIRIKTPAQIRSKSQEYRSARRKLQFAAEFSDALGHIIKLDSVSLWNTCFRAGRPLSWQYIKSIEDAIDCRILHAEIAGNTVFTVAEQACKGETRKILQDKFPAHNMLLAATDCFTNLLCGLADENGNTLDVGLIQAVDFKRMFIFVLSGIKTISPVRVVQIGSVRISRDGRELGILKPGEI